MSTAPTTSTATTASQKVKSAPFSISNISQTYQWLKRLVYGAHGAGKTTLLKTIT